MLTVVAADVLPRGVARAVALLALALLVRVVRPPGRRAVAAAVAEHRGAALAAWFGPSSTRWRSRWCGPRLMAPRRPDEVTVRTLLGIPLELLLFVALAVVLPPRLGPLLASARGRGAGRDGGAQRCSTSASTRPSTGPSTRSRDPGFVGSRLGPRRTRSAGRDAVRSWPSPGAARWSDAGWRSASGRRSRIRTRRPRRTAVWARVVVALTAGLGRGAGSAVRTWRGVPVAVDPAASLVRSARSTRSAPSCTTSAVFEPRLAPTRYAARPAATCCPACAARTCCSCSSRATAGWPWRTRGSPPTVDQHLDDGTPPSWPRPGLRLRSAWLRLADLRRRSAGWRTRRCSPGLWVDSQQRYDQRDAQRPVHPRPGLRPGRLAHRQRRPVGRGRLAARAGVLRLRPDVRLPQRRVRRAALRLRPDARPVHARARSTERELARAAPPAGDGRDRPGLQPRPWIAAAPPGAVGRSSATARSTTGCTPRTSSCLDLLGGPRTQQAPLRPVDPLLAALAGVLRAARARQEPGDGRARRPPAATPASAAAASRTTCRSRWSPTTPRCCGRSPAGAGHPACSRDPDAPVQPMDALPRPLPRGVRLAPRRRGPGHDRAWNRGPIEPGRFCFVSSG